MYLSKLMSFCLFMLLTPILLVESSFNLPVHAEENRPNIIFILTDDQRADAMGCMGNEMIDTPQLDKLAAEGTLFENAYCTTAICMTSRASFLLGQYERRHQITSFRTPLTDEQFALTFPAQLRQSGYYTGMVGKWGLGSPLPKDKYDYFEGYLGQGQYYPKEKKDQPGEHLTAKLAQQAVEFLNQVPDDKPFCMQLYTKAAHCQDGVGDQFPADVKYDSLFADTTLPTDELVNEKYFKALPEFLKTSEARVRWHRRFEGTKLREQSIKDYYRLVKGIDDLLGRVRKQLKDSGKADNTVIIFSSDHGFYLGERGLAGKWFMHEESIRIPMIVYDPRLPENQRGQRLKQMVLSIDVSPTIMELAGVKTPQAVQGESLMNLIEHPEQKGREEFLYEHRFEHKRIPQSEGVRTDRWKYVRYTKVEPIHEELYDLEQDPREVNNLAQNADYAERLEMMRTRWKQLSVDLQ